MWTGETQARFPQEKCDGVKPLVEPAGTTMGDYINMGLQK